MKKGAIFAVIGTVVAATASAIIGYKIDHQKEHYDLANAGKCERCIMHLKCRTAVSWTKHLIQDHGCTEDDAYTTIDRVYMRIHKIAEEQK